MVGLRGGETCQPALGGDFPAWGAGGATVSGCWEIQGSERELLPVPKGRCPHRQEVTHNSGTTCIKTHVGSRP